MEFSLTDFVLVPLHDNGCNWQVVRVRPYEELKYGDERPRPCAAPECVARSGGGTGASGMGDATAFNGDFRCRILASAVAGRAERLSADAPAGLAARTDSAAADAAARMMPSRRVT